jgi:hypothetical protein
MNNVQFIDLFHRINCICELKEHELMIDIK